PRRPRGVMRSSKRHRRTERFDADVAMLVLAALDRQLAVLTEIRNTLTAGRHAPRWSYLAAVSGLGDLCRGRGRRRRPVVALRLRSRPHWSTRRTTGGRSPSPAAKNFR